MEYIINVKNVRKKFENYERAPAGFMSSLRRNRKTTRALRGVNLEVRKGEIVALLGRNGSGKSTLIKLISGILHPDSGTVTTIGLDPWEQRRSLAENIGVVFGATHPQLYWNLPPIDTFKYIRDLYGIKDSDYQKRLRYFIKLLNLSHVYNKQTRQLSMGERMKCEVVAALLHLPKLVIMDEPTVGVDLPARIAVKKAVQRMRKDYGTTFLITTHVVDDVSNVDRIVMLDKGKVVFDGTRERMRRMLAKHLVLELRFSQDTNIEDLDIRGRIRKEEPGYAKIEINPNELKKKWLKDLITSDHIFEYRIMEPNLSTILERFYASNDKRITLSDDEDEY